jgi:DNA-binding NtrC family response regulator
MLHSLEDLEREAIKLTLEGTHYKIGRAADILGISRKTLLEKRKKYGLI